ncbi:MAG: murein hydrolase activator EnvC family protein [Clostridia bacterium]
MKQKIVAISIILGLTAYLCSFSIVQAETLDEQKANLQNQIQESTNQLEYVQEELSSGVVKIQELDDKIRTAQQEISNFENQLKELQTKVEETTNHLTHLQQDYDENEKLLEERLVVLYESGETTYLDILLKSASLTEFLSNYYTIQQVVETDTELLESISKQKAEVEITKNQLEEQKSNLKLLKAKKEQTYIVMQNNKTIQENYMNQLSDNEKELQKKIEEYKAEEQRVENLIQLAAGQGYEGEYTGGVMAWPIAKSGTYITSPFGYREHPIQGVIKLHSGIDIGNAGFGAPVIAAADGIVTLASYNGGYGNCVMINHGNGISTLYGHGQKILTTVGTQVKKGDLILEVGSTGNSTGPHLHFEVRVNGKAVNPIPYLQE